MTPVFGVDAQAEVIVAPRSNNELDSSRLRGEFPGVLDIKASLIKYVFEPNAERKDEIKAAVSTMRAEHRAASKA